MKKFKKIFTILVLKTLCIASGAASASPTVLAKNTCYQFVTIENIATYNPDYIEFTSTNLPIFKLNKKPKINFYMYDLQNVLGLKQGEQIFSKIKYEQKIFQSEPFLYCQNDKTITFTIGGTEIEPTIIKKH